MSVVQRSTSELVGENVRKLRLARGWNQTELGRRIGRPQSRITEIEHGKLALSGALIDALADAFGVRQADLVSEVEEKLQTTT